MGILILEYTQVLTWRKRWGWRTLVPWGPQGLCIATDSRWVHCRFEVQTVNCDKFCEVKRQKEILCEHSSLHPHSPTLEAKGFSHSYWTWGPLWSHGFHVLIFQTEDVIRNLLWTSGSSSFNHVSSVTLPSTGKQSNQYRIKIWGLLPTALPGNVLCHVMKIKTWESRLFYLTRIEAIKTSWNISAVKGAVQCGNENVNVYL